jgi:hypothetical protein
MLAMRGMVHYASSLNVSLHRNAAVAKVKLATKLSRHSLAIYSDSQRQVNRNLPIVLPFSRNIRASASTIANVHGCLDQHLILMTCVSFPSAEYACRANRLTWEWPPE